MSDNLSNENINTGVSREMRNDDSSFWHFNSHWTYFQYAYYSQYKTLASTIFPIFFAFYMGAWCDMFGRKLLMKIYLLSRIITKCGHIFCAYFMYSSKWWILLTDIPSWISGMLPIYIKILFIVKSTQFKKLAPNALKFTY